MQATCTYTWYARLNFLSFSLSLSHSLRITQLAPCRATESYTLWRLSSLLQEIWHHEICWRFVLFFYLLSIHLQCWTFNSLPSFSFLPLSLSLSLSLQQFQTNLPWSYTNPTMSLRVPTMLLQYQPQDADERLETATGLGWWHLVRACAVRRLSTRVIVKKVRRLFRKAGNTHIVWEEGKLDILV